MSCFSWEKIEWLYIIFIPAYKVFKIPFLAIIEWFEFKFKYRLAWVSFLYTKDSKLPKFFIISMLIENRNVAILLFFNSSDKLKIYQGIVRRDCKWRMHHQYNTAKLFIGLNLSLLNVSKLFISKLLKKCDRGDPIAIPKFY